MTSLPIFKGANPLELVLSTGFVDMTSSHDPTEQLKGVTSLPIFKGANPLKRFVPGFMDMISSHDPTETA